MARRLLRSAPRIAASSRTCRMLTCSTRHVGSPPLPTNSLLRSASAVAREATVGDPCPPGPQRYRVQFTADEEHIQLLERAQALLGDGTSLPELYLEAMRQLVAQLEKRERKQELCPRGEPESSDAGPARPARAENETESADLADSEIDSEIEHAGTDIPRQRGRYIPVAIRRAVRQRDEYCCTFVSEEGRRCCEVSRLEFHHVKPFALLRKHTVEGITLRCRAHNAFAAEEDFGREKILSKRDGTRHEAFVRQRRD